VGNHAVVGHDFGAPSDVNAFRTPTREGAADGEGALGPYLSALRTEKLLVTVVTLITVVVAVGWLLLREPRYEASAQVLVTPLPQDDQTFLSLQLLRDSGDPTRTVQTAATLLDSPRLAAVAARTLGDGWTAGRVDEAISVEAAGESNILAVTASAGSAREARRVANGYVAAALEERNRALQAQIAKELERLRARQSTLDPAGAESAELGTKISELESVAARGDPTFALSQRAAMPQRAQGAGPLIVIPVALLAGFAIGSGAALLVELFDRRVHSENELLAVYPLPILARVPRLSGQERRRMTHDGWLAPPAVHEAFRTVFAQLNSLGDEHPRRLMVTSASTRDGKTTSAISLAMVIGASGHSVILVDLDLRKHAVARYLGIHSEQAAVPMRDSRVSSRRFSRLLHDVPYLPNVKVLTLGPDSAAAGLVHALEGSAAALLEHAAERAEYVVVDTPPLGEVSDALTFASATDATILVARLGRTRLSNLEFTRDLLERGGHTPLGYIVVAVPRRSTGSYYHSSGVAALPPRPSARQSRNASAGRSRGSPQGPRRV
jgi:tyrosine-protein kinase